MPIDPLLKGANDLVSTGFLGTLIVVMAYIIVYLWRENKAQRKQGDVDREEERARYETDIAKIREKHDVEMAEQRRLNLELQNARLTELKAALADVVKVTGTVEQALIALHGGAK